MKIQQCLQCLLELQLKMSGMFFGDTVYIVADSSTITCFM